MPNSTKVGAKEKGLFLLNNKKKGGKRLLHHLILDRPGTRVTRVSIIIIKKYTEIRTLFFPLTPAIDTTTTTTHK